MNILKSEFKNQVIVKKVFPNEVPDFLKVGDYGLLIREETITNKVASPVKFAEYLACGLYVIISDNLGDYTQFVLNNNCGCITSEFNFQNKTTKNQLAVIARKYFTKKQFKNCYIELVNL